MSFANDRKRRVWPIAAVDYSDLFIRNHISPLRMFIKRGEKI